MSNLTKIESLKVDAIRKSLEYNAFVAANDASGMGTALNGLKEIEKEYKKEAFNEFVKTIRSTENPVLTAIRTLQYEIMKHREIKSDGVTTGIELYITDDTVNMSKVFERLGISNVWSALAQKLNYMYTLRKALEHGIEGEEFKAIKDNYMIADEVKKAISGKTPTSNTKMAEALQNVIDALIFVPRDDGKNTYRALGYHANALGDWQMTKSRKAIGTSDAAGDKAFDNYVVEIAHCIVTGKNLKIVGKNINGTKIEPKHIKVELVVPAAETEENIESASAPVAAPAPSEEVEARDVPAEPAKTEE